LVRAEIALTVVSCYPAAWWEACVVPSPWFAKGWNPLLGEFER
jgi:hypothetical protein